MGNISKITENTPADKITYPTIHTIIAVKDSWSPVVSILNERKKIIPHPHTPLHNHHNPFFHPPYDDTDDNSIPPYGTVDDQET